jgi:hypothetical protein
VWHCKGTPGAITVPDIGPVHSAHKEGQGLQYPVDNSIYLVVLHLQVPSIRTAFEESLQLRHWLMAPPEQVKQVTWQKIGM